MCRRRWSTPLGGRFDRDPPKPCKLHKSVFRTVDLLLKAQVPEVDSVKRHSQTSLLPPDEGSKNPVSQRDTLIPPAGQVLEDQIMGRFPVFRGDAPPALAEDGRQQDEQPNILMDPLCCWHYGLLPFPRGRVTGPARRCVSGSENEERGNTGGNPAPGFTPANSTPSPTLHYRKIIYQTGGFRKRCQFFPPY